MGLGVLVLGGSGTGKSYSIKNFDLRGGEDSASVPEEVQSSKAGYL